MGFQSMLASISRVIYKKYVSAIGFMLVVVASMANAATVSHFDDFEFNSGNWSNVTIGDNKDWTRDSGGTPSVSTGPASGASGSTYYYYLETSSGSAYIAGDSAILLGPTLAVRTGVTLSFAYHMYGQNMGALAVDVLSNGSWLNDVWSISGQQQIGNAAAYARVTVDLGAYSVDQIRFRATAAGGYMGDMAIDNVEIAYLNSAPAAPQFVNDPIVKAGAREGEIYSDSIAGEAIDSNGDQLTYTLVSAAGWLSVAADGALSGLPGPGDVGQNSFVIRASDGGLSTTAELLIEVVSANAPSVVSFTDFESGYGDWQNITTTEDNKNWTRDSAGTPSSGTGPVSGAGDSAYYAYLETSSGGAYTSGDTAILLGPELSGANVQLSFKYHMYGSSMGSLAVDVLSEGSWINSVWSISGQQHTSNSAAYSQADVDLSGYSVQQIRFRATAAGSYTGDMALDDIVILAAPHGAAPLAFQSDELRKSDGRVGTVYSDSIAADASGGNGSALNYYLVSGPSWLQISGTGELSGLPGVGDVGDNRFTVGVSDGEVVASASLWINVAYANTPLVLSDSDFESGMDDWSNVTGIDDYDWIRNSGGTTSSNTGPSGGADGSLFYMYLETSSGSAFAAGDTAILQGPVVTSDNVVFRFKYHMYGVDMGTLSVDVLNNGVWINDIWFISGQQHASTTAAYTQVELDMSAYNLSQIRFRATAAGNYMGDMAIDDIQIQSVDPQGLDSDGDGVQNGSDLCANTSVGDPVDANGCSAAQRDSDSDGYSDQIDAFPNDPAEWLDTDGDLIGNNADQDDDGDAVLDGDDVFPLDALEWLDTDGDGFGNNADLDDDGDGVADVSDVYPLISLGGLVDTDRDGVPNDCDSACQALGMVSDTDDDNDGVDDSLDAFPQDASETEDTDNDGMGNNADLDDDNDGILDVVDAFPLISVVGYLDTDSDGAPNDCDAACLALGMGADGDDDNDAVPDISDAFPLDASESADTDGDGVGDNGDAFPGDPSESVDTDGDGVGDNGDVFPSDPSESADTDGDGVGDNSDAFPSDPSESVDTDGDGVGDNSDVFPNDPSESADTDGDGVGDNSDAFPSDPSESVDSDGDGVGDNSDQYPTYYSPLANVDIMSPADVTIVAGTPLSFFATAYDASVGDISNTVKWESDLSGEFTPDPISGEFVLPHGEHAIVAVVIDSQGNMASEYVRVVVTNEQASKLQLYPELESVTDVSESGQYFAGHVVSSGDNPVAIWNESTGLWTSSNYLGVYDFKVSDAGSVVGAINNGSSYSAMILQGSGSNISSTTLNNLSSSNPSSYARDISADGNTIVGMSRGPSGSFDAVVWDASGNVYGLGSLGNYTSATSTSATGDVIVGYGGSSPNFITSGHSGWRWDAHSGMQLLGDLVGGSGASHPANMTPDGSVIVGYARSAAGTEAFIWNQDEGMRGLGAVLGSTRVETIDITANGRMVVGNSENGPFIWTQGLGLRDLQAYIESIYGIQFNDADDPYPGHISRVTYVSDDGNVVAGQFVRQVPGYSKQYSGFVVRLTARPGEIFESATLDFGNRIRTTPVQGQSGELIFATDADEVIAIDEFGEGLWRFAVGAQITDAVTDPQTGDLYFGAFDGSLYALKSNGVLKWSLQPVTTPYSKPALGPDGTVYVLSAGFRLHAIAPDGTILWVNSLSFNGYDNAAYYYPVVGGDGQIYVATYDGLLYAVNQEGEVEWVFDVSPYTSSSRRMLRPPVVTSAGLVVLGGSYGSLFALDSAGVLQWQHSSNDGQASAAALPRSPVAGPDGTVYIAVDTYPDSSGYLQAVDSNGSLLWQHNLTGRAYHTPTITQDGRVLVRDGSRGVRSIWMDGGLDWYSWVDKGLVTDIAVTALGAAVVGDSAGLLHFIDEP
ncbi:thrombospondin type 3 repeat-containing protein [Ketobacter alkanivorans]|uniref:MAM domain-containing protein n=1 Tax=Ketobacter alkanivorans TaxID=1917421 RepID=A0A2K9LN09_9GAMM|nr:thrombospondin type 3 repeat-containing protein [Ketobacter alkanivorans]AUM13672.1 hypothetical protein Kalk_15120 [Ketobacter alkanivorans]